MTEISDESKRCIEDLNEKCNGFLNDIESFIKERKQEIENYDINDNEKLLLLSFMLGSLSLQMTAKSFILEKIVTGDSKIISKILQDLIEIDIKDITQFINLSSMVKGMFVKDEDKE